MDNRQNISGSDTRTKETFLNNETTLEKVGIIGGGALGIVLVIAAATKGGLNLQTAYRNAKALHESALANQNELSKIAKNWNKYYNGDNASNLEDSYTLVTNAYKQLVSEGNAPKAALETLKKSIPENNFNFEKAAGFKGNIVNEAKDYKDTFNYQSGQEIYKLFNVVEESVSSPLLG